MAESASLRHEQQTGRIRRITVVGAIVNLSLSGVKTGVGVLGGSQALVADGVHSLSDLLTDFAVWAGAYYWNAPADDSHPYGHGRVETLVNLFIALALAGVGLGIGWHALVTITAPDAHPPGWWAFGVAVLSILLKEGLFRWTIRQGREARSSAVVANAWHHRSDALSSVPVAVAVITGRLYPEMAYLDHVAALIVTVMLLGATWEIGWPCLKELTESARSCEMEKLVAEVVSRFPEISEVHKVRCRRMGSMLTVDLHLLVAPETSVRSAHDTSEAFKEALLQAREELVDVLVHIEPADPAERTQGACRYSPESDSF